MIKSSYAVRTFAFALLLSVCALPPLARAQGTAAVIAAGSTVNSVVDNLRNSLEEILAKLDQSVSSGTFLARMQVSNLLAELNYHATEVLGKTFDQLDKQQQEFFRNAQQTVNDLQAMGDHIAENADTVVQRVEFAVASVPFTATEPRLRSVTPRVIEISQIAQPVRITFDGSWLANGDPQLTLGSVACKLSDLAEPKATFECPSTAFASNTASGARYVHGQFLAVQQQGFWDGVWTFFGARPKVKAYPASIAIVPTEFGHIKVLATATTYTDESNRRSARYDTGAQHCTWGSETLVNITPAGPDWTIDVNSISLVLESGEHSELRNVTPGGFQVYAVGHNHGNCIKALGQTVSYDARGWASGHVDWTEHRKVPKPETTSEFDGDLSWGDTKVVLLPDGVQSYVVSATLFNGKTRDYNAPTKDEFLVLERDDANHSLKLSPRPLSDAFK